MGGVDKGDQLLSYYGFTHRTVKWWRRAFFHLFDVAIGNAYILYTISPRLGRRLTHEHFRIELAKELLVDASSAAETTTLHTPGPHSRLLPPHSRLTERHFPGRTDDTAAGRPSQPDQVSLRMLCVMSALGRFLHIIVHSFACPTLVPHKILSVILDFLYYIHRPPPPDISTFSEYFQYLWNAAVTRNLSISKYLYIVIDKPDYLPPPRKIVHEGRRKKSGYFRGVEPVIEDNAPLPHGTTFDQLLALTSFKSKLIHFITQKIIQASIDYTALRPATIVVDSPSVTCPQKILNGTLTEHLINHHGEADYAMWHHAIHSTTSNILIVSSDTDTWVYGLGLSEHGYLAHKQVYVQRGYSGDFVDINLGTLLISQCPKLQTISYPVSSVVALYLLTGCDYVSSFYFCKKNKILKHF